MLARLLIIIIASTFASESAQTETRVAIGSKATHTGIAGTLGDPSILVAENLKPSAAKSLEFKEDPKPKSSRGPASITAPSQPAFQEITDEETEAGFCLFCGTTGGGARARTLVEQSEEILKQAERSASGK